ncbi:MAG: ornithine carbamoyltransferase [Candidatus Omnitrophota bacterium]
MKPYKKNNFISLKSFSPDALRDLVRLTAKTKKNKTFYEKSLAGKFVGLLFEKPSLRTKTSFYLGALGLGAQVIYYSPDEIRLGKRENVSDVANTLSRYLDIAVLRTFSHKTIEEFAEASPVSTVNALSDKLHPSQVLGDIFTLLELKKDIPKIKFCYIGDVNNVCHSLLYAFSILGGNIYVATAKGYEPDSHILKECRNIAAETKATIEISNSPLQCASRADVIYTDVWASMGKEKERSMRKKAFKKFQVNDKLLSLAKSSCCIMHCLPAHRNEEITDSVLKSKNSIVFLQAENRFYSAQAILLWCTGIKK